MANIDPPRDILVDVDVNCDQQHINDAAVVDRNHENHAEQVMPESLGALSAAERQRLEREMVRKLDFVIL
jgi:hypothetical protein